MPVPWMGRNWGGVEFDMRPSESRSPPPPSPAPSRGRASGASNTRLPDSGEADSGEAGRLAGLVAVFAGRRALEEEAVKVDRLEQQGREAAFLHGLRHDLAREGEED